VRAGCRQVIDVSSDCSPERLQTGKRPIISRKSHSACNEAETNDLRITKAAQTHSDHVVAKTLLGTCEFFGEGTAPAHLIRNELPRFKQLAPLGFQRSIQRPTCRYPVAQSARWFCATRYSQSTLLIPCRAHKFLRATAVARRFHVRTRRRQSLNPRTDVEPVQSWYPLGRFFSQLRNGVSRVDFNVFVGSTSSTIT